VTPGCRSDLLLAAPLGATDLARRRLDDDPASIRMRVSPNMVQLLLDAGGSRDVRDPIYDGAPLDWAQHGMSKSWQRASGDYAETVRILERR
jgi:hypothetical protein